MNLSIFFTENLIQIIFPNVFICLSLISDILFMNYKRLTIRAEKSYHLINRKYPKKHLKMHLKRIIIVNYIKIILNIFKTNNYYKYVMLKKSSSIFLNLNY